jgi:hypothetical protein
MAEGCLPPTSPDPRHHERDYANALYVNQSYSRNDRATDRLARHLHTVNFNMKAEDLDQPWFFKQASREIALSLLTNRDSGSFLVRPSSQRGCYALSYVTPTGEIRHDLIYDLYPGFSLQKNPNPTSHERYWSLSALIENCPYLKFTSGLDNKSNAKDVRSAQAKSM